ncbi:MAG: response regulator [Anaerolineae bacterium]|nr:response regulator [Anaerolineae bacterium]
MSSIPRVVVADHIGDVAGIVRGAITLLDRRCIVVEVPSAQEAIEELSNASVDLLVTAYSLPEQNGVELASRAIRESAATSIIVLARPDDPEVDAHSLENVPYVYLVRPVGEPFLRALRVGLDGEAAVAVQETSGSSSSALDLGPIPVLDTSIVTDNLMQIMLDTGATGVFFADRMGHVIASEGAANYYDFNREVCAALLAPSVARTADLRDLTGGNAWTLQYYDGERYDIFVLSLGVHYFLGLLFDGTKRAAFGSVTNYGRKTVDGILDKMGAEAWTFRRNTSTITQSMSAIRVEEVEEEEESAEPLPAPAAPEPKSVPAAEDQTDLDPDKLFSQKVDESQFDSLFSEEDFKSETVFLTGNVVSFDDAMDMGILDQ